MDIIQQIEKEQMDAVKLKRAIPEFSPGDTLKVMVRVAETVEVAAKDKKAAKGKPPELTFRLQAYEGVCIARSGRGLNESFTVRKISYGEGVERVFPVYSPLIGEIEVVRRGKVRRAKLYYLRGRRGKAARIVERSDARARRLNAAFKGFKRPKGSPDDLKLIKGISPEIETGLHRLNVIKFDQIATWSDDDIANVDEALTLKGAIEKGDWSSAAQKLVAEAAAAEVPVEEKK